MDDTIIALLNNNLRVIIPDFGAFIIRQKQPRIIVFNEFLRYNDGILIDSIVKTEGIDRDIAEQRVMDFAEDGSKLLASGRELVIEGLGSLKKDSSGKVSFIEAPEFAGTDEKGTVAVDFVVEDEKKTDVPPVVKKKIPKKAKAKAPAMKKGRKAKIAPKLKKATEIAAEEPPSIEPATEPPVLEKAAEPAGIEPATEPPVLEKAAEPAGIEPATEPPVLEKAAEPAGIEPATEPPVLEKAAEPAGIEPATEPPVLEETRVPVAIEVTTNQSVAEIGTSVEPHPQIEVPVDLAQEGVDDAGAPFRHKIEPVPPVQRSPQAEAAASDDRSVPISTNRILAWVLIILFVNAGILSWFVFRKKTQGKSIGKSESAIISDTLYDQLADSVRAAALDTSIVYGENPETVDYPEENAQTPGSRYYIVAGCFRDEINADLLVNSLKQQGYKAEKFGKIGNLFAVCFGSFDKKEEAVPELKKIREKDPSAWMTKF